MMYTKWHIRWWYPLALLVVLAALAACGPGTADVCGEARPSVLIIDAGHGGADGGAVAPDGTPESEINLDIARRVEALARFCGVDTVMTRTQEDIDYPAEAKTISARKKADQNARLALINDIPDGMLLSIHQNNYPAAAPSGIQVFYGTADGSEDLAKLMQENLTGRLDPDDRRVASPVSESVYLMRKAQCPAILVECGFLSNPGDLQKLEKPDYRASLAVVMLASYLQYTRGTSQ